MRVTEIYWSYVHLCAFPITGIGCYNSKDNKMSGEVQKAIEESTGKIGWEKQKEEEVREEQGKKRKRQSNRIKKGRRKPPKNKRQRE